MQSEASCKAFGKRLKDLRNQQRWTQKEVAAKIGLQISQLNKYECGMHVPPADKLVQLAEIFNTTTDYLLTGSVTDAQPINNVRLLERFRALEGFNLKDQDTVLKLIDAMIVKHRVEGAVKPLSKSARR